MAYIEYRHYLMWLTGYVANAHILLEEGWLEIYILYNKLFLVICLNIFCLNSNFEKDSCSRESRSGEESGWKLL